VRLASFGGASDKRFPLGLTQMPFYDRDYSVLLLLPGPAAPELWKSSNWKVLEAAINPYMASQRGKASVRTIQYSSTGKPISFGRLGWDSKSHEKWVHQETGLEGAIFVHVEVWSPSWSQSEKDNRAPDFYFALANERRIGSSDKKLLFNQRLICAIAHDREPGEIASLEQRFALLAKQLSAAVFAKTTRPWGLSIGGGGFTSALQDMAISHLFKPGDPHARPLDQASLSEPWQFVRAQ
jgi:hypothetical protein